MLNELAYAQGVEDGLAKFAASKLRQRARDMTQTAWNSGDSGAAAKARDATQLAYGAPKFLGKGGEGTAMLSMRPQAYSGGALTPTVRKTYDPKAELASPELIDRRIALGPNLNETGNFAKYYGHGTDAQGKRYIDNEYIRGKVPEGADVSKAQSKIDASVRSEGMKSGLGHLTAKDTRAANLGVHQQTGKTVSLDYNPMKRDEVYDPRFARRQGLEQSAILPTDKGTRVFPNMDKGFRDPGGVAEKRRKEIMADDFRYNPAAREKALHGKPDLAENVAMAPPPPGVKVPGESVFGNMDSAPQQIATPPTAPARPANVAPPMGNPTAAAKPKTAPAMPVTAPIMPK